MARPTRVTIKGLTHHVFSRCIEKRTMLLDEFASELLLDIVRRAQEKYDFELIAYQIMDNHFHFIIRTLEEGPTISRIMQYIKARFSERYNRLTDRTGPLWNERFKDIIVEKTDNPQSYLLWLLWYLAFNPARKSIQCDPRSYRYSSINCYLDENHKSPVRVTLHSYFILLGKSFKERVDSFLWYEKAYRSRWSISL